MAARPIDASGFERELIADMSLYGEKISGDEAYSRALLLLAGAPTLRPVSREQIEKVWPGCHECSGCKLCIWNETKKCNDCKNRNSFRPLSDFCPRCGKPLTDEAVEIMLKRMEALLND